MSEEIKKTQETNQVESKAQEFSFFRELKALIKKAFTSEDTIENSPPTPTKVETTVSSSDIKTDATGRAKVTNSLEHFIQNTDDKTYNNVINVGKRLLHSIKGDSPENKLPPKSSQQQYK